MTTLACYEQAIERFFHLGLPDHIQRGITNIVEHHILRDLDLPHPRSVELAAKVITELCDVAEGKRGHELKQVGDALHLRLLYWKGTARLRHDTGSLEGAEPFPPFEWNKIMAATRHVAHYLCDAPGYLRSHPKQQVLTPP